MEIFLIEIKYYLRTYWMSCLFCNQYIAIKSTERRVIIKLI